MARVIGVTGYKGSGKGEVAKVLMEEGYANIKFAEPLKAMLRAIGLTDRHIEGDLKEEPCQLLLGQTPRHAMQTLGTEWGRRHLGENFWVGIAQNRARLHLLSGTPVVIDDVRFPNEAEAISRMGGTLVRVIRPDNVIDASHPSEALIGTLRADITIINDGTLDDLNRRVRAELGLPVRGAYVPSF